MNDSIKNSMAIWVDADANHADFAECLKEEGRLGGGSQTLNFTLTPINLTPITHI